MVKIIVGLNCTFENLQDPLAMLVFLHTYGTWIAQPFSQAISPIIPLPMKSTSFINPSGISEENWRDLKKKKI